MSITNEGHTYTDARSGRTIRQLTSVGNNVHLYFTDNSFNTQDDSIIFLSDRASSQRRAPHEDPHYNIFRLALGSGALTQLTDEPQPVGRVTQTSDGALIAYTVGKQVKLLDTQAGTSHVVYEETGGYKLGMPSMSANRRLIAVACNEPSAAHGPNYSGFKERYYGIKDGRIQIAYADGSGSFEAWRDTCQLAHVQFSPDDPTMLMFCHEGPWNLVPQRIWMLDIAARNVWPCFRQGADDAVGHEFWTMDGLIFFDNRGPGHDGTITSERTQAVASHVGVNENTFTPYVGLMDRRGVLQRRLDMPFYCNHYHANPNNTLLVGDDVDTLVMIDISGDEAKLDVLCEHRTSWHTQSSHCHPTWSYDGRRILYASDESGQVQLYLLEMV